MVIGRVQKKQFNIIYFLRNNLRLYYRAKIVFLANGAGTTIYSDAKKKKKESRHSPYTITKMNSKCIIDLNVKHKTIKLLENNNRRNPR